MSATEGKVITCRAAVAWEPNKPLVIEEVQVAPPKAHEVRIKIYATGVCHTDASGWRGLNDTVRFPVIFGHEGAGVVESVGQGVTEFKVGDHVIPLYVTQCEKCAPCKSGKTNLCEKSFIKTFGGLFLDGSTRFTCKGQDIHGFMGTSTFSEYTVVSDVALAKINDKAPMDKICLIGCCIPTGYGAAVNTANVTPGSVCAVWGLGGVGLAVVMGCKKAGASKIYGIDTNPDKKEFSKIFGVTDFINPIDLKVPIKDYLIEQTGGGCDFTFEAIGNINTMRAAFDSTREGYGTSVIIGVAASGKEISLAPIDLLLGRSIKGTACGGYRGKTGFPQLVEAYMKKELLCDEFITHNLTLDQINDAFVYMFDGKSIRSVVKF